MEKYEIKTHTIPSHVKVEDWLLFIIIVGVSAILYFLWLATYGTVGLIIITAICIAAIIIVVKRLHHRTRRNIQRQADQTAKTLQGLFDDAPLLISQMKAKVELATQHVSDAEQAYRDRAFAPFWDSVESTTKIIFQYNVHANDLSNSINNYNGLIDRMTEEIGHEYLEHNFPTFPYSMDQVPVPVKVYDDLKRLVYDAQKDFEFAVIWEHRHTRQVLIGGFETLGQAIGNLQGRINSSVDSLKESLSPKPIGMDRGTGSGQRRLKG